jgi:phage gp46-like protein
MLSMSSFDLVQCMCRNLILTMDTFGDYRKAQGRLQEANDLQNGGNIPALLLGRKSASFRLPLFSNGYWAGDGMESGARTAIFRAQRKEETSSVPLSMDATCGLSENKLHLPKNPSD